MKVDRKREKDFKINRCEKLLKYCSTSGKFYWITKSALQSNIKIGQEAGTLNKIHGYRVIRIDGTHYYAHRLAWFVTYGKFPLEQVDHINGKRDDNRIENLRDVPPQINSRNRSKRVREDINLPTGVRVGHRNRFGEVTGYTAYWVNSTGEQQQKYFSVSGFGTHEATIQAASICRLTAIRELNIKGESYSDKHGI